MSLLTALMVVFVVFTAGGVWAGVATQQVGASALERDRERAFASAEAGLNDAMARLARDAGACDDYALDLDGEPSTIEAEVSFDPTFDCADPNVDLRYIVSRGYAPHRDAPTPQRRQLEQQVRLVPEQGFTFGLFSAPQGITAGNNMTVNGDIFSSSDLNLANSSKVFGDVVSLGSVTINNNSVVDGRVHAAGDVTLASAGGTVAGDVWSLGAPHLPTPNVSVSGWVKGNAQAAGTVGVQTGGRIDGDVTEYSSPPPPNEQALPVFDPSALTYTSTWSSAAAWKTTVWTPGASPNTGSVNGTYRLAGGAVGALSLDKRWNIGGDLTIVSDAPIDLSRDVVNVSGGEVTLALISLDPSASAVSMTNNLSLPQDIRILFFAPNGCADFRNLKHFTGTVYARCIVLDNQFTLTFFPVEHEGFTWTLASASAFTIEAQVFREVRFSG